MRNRLVFTGAACPKQAHHLTGVDGKGDIVDDAMPGSIGFDNALKAERHRAMLAPRSILSRFPTLRAQ